VRGVCGQFSQPADRRCQGSATSVVRTPARRSGRPARATSHRARPTSGSSFSRRGRFRGRLHAQGLVRSGAPRHQPSQFSMSADVETGPRESVGLPTEDSPSGLGRTLGKRVGCKPSGVRIPHPPPLTCGNTVHGFLQRDRRCLPGLISGLIWPANLAKIQPGRRPAATCRPWSRARRSSLDGAAHAAGSCASESGGVRDCPPPSACRGQ
jgi:hypothetical protein